MKTLVFQNLTEKEKNHSNTNNNNNNEGEEMQKDTYLPAPPGREIEHIAHNTADRSFQFLWHLSS